MNTDPLGYRLVSRQLAGLRQSDDATADQHETNEQFLRIITWSIVVLASLAIIASLHIARFVAIPVVAGVVVGLIMGPVGDRAAAVRIPKAITFTVLITLLLAALALMVWLALPIMEAIIVALPQAAQRLHGMLDFTQGWLSTFDQIKGSGSRLPIGHGNQPPPTETLAPSPMSLATSVLSVVTPALSQTVIFLFSLVLFLASRSHWRQAVARLFTGRDDRLKALKRYSAVENQLTDYFVVVTAINVGLGVVVGLVFWMAGIPAAFSWAILAFFLNYLPVVGPLFLKGLLLTFGLLLYPDLGPALLPFSLFLIISLLEANLVTPRIVAARLTVDPLAVFLSVVLLTWLWGFAGAFLAMPLLAIAAVVAERDSQAVRLPE